MYLERQILKVCFDSESRPLVYCGVEFVLAILLSLFDAFGAGHGSGHRSERRFIQGLLPFGVGFASLMADCVWAAPTGSTDQNDSY
jgi:hypothetical protein